MISRSLRALSVVGSVLGVDSSLARNSFRRKLSSVKQAAILLAKQDATTRQNLLELERSLKSPVLEVDIEDENTEKKSQKKSALESPALEVDIEDENTEKKSQKNSALKSPALEVDIENENTEKKSRVKGVYRTLPSHVTFEAPYQLALDEDDLEESFFESEEFSIFSKKTANCVELKHRPTGVKVKVQDFRVLEMNRKLARMVLAEKVDLKLNGRDSAVYKHRERQHELGLKQKEMNRYRHKQKESRRQNWDQGFGSRGVGRSFAGGGFDRERSSRHRGNQSRRNSDSFEEEQTIKSQISQSRQRFNDRRQRSFSDNDDDDILF